MQHLWRGKAVLREHRVVCAFVHLCRMLATNQDLARKIEALERKVGKHDAGLPEMRSGLRHWA